MKGNVCASLPLILLFCMAAFSTVSCNREREESSVKEVSVPVEQQTDMQDTYSTAPFTGGLRLNFQMSGITHIELESVDGFAIAGAAKFVTSDGQVLITEVTDKQSIITIRAPQGGTFAPGKDYYIVTFPCDVYGGYRLSIFKDGKVAHYFSVHQRFKAGAYVAPLDLEEDELEFVDPNAPFVEDERPGLNAATRIALENYRHNPTEENKQASSAYVKPENKP